MDKVELPDGISETWWAWWVPLIRRIGLEPKAVKLDACPLDIVLVSSVIRVYHADLDLIVGRLVGGRYFMMKSKFTDDGPWCQVGVNPDLFIAAVPDYCRDRVRRFIKDEDK